MDSSATDDWKSHPPLMEKKKYQQPAINKQIASNIVIHFRYQHQCCSKKPIRLYQSMSTPSIPPTVQLGVIVLLCFLFMWTYQSCSQPKILLSPISLATMVPTSTDCQQSLLESDGFLCEPNATWIERKNVYFNQDEENMMKYGDPIFFISIWEPNFHCTHSRRIGKMGDGGKWVCDPYRLESRDDCLVYSVGSNGDFSFEIDMKKFMPHCEIHTFDKNNFTCPNKTCTFHTVMFGDGIQPNGSKSWMTIIKSLNHTNRYIDILKIDIEGGEYSFFPLVFNSSKSLFPRQILIELHPTNVTRVHSFFELLRNNNYVIFSKENNLYAGPFFFEYAFLKLNPRFFVRSTRNQTNK
ncbi:unnamed protein product [Rotaria magnacalcarata]|uniref:Methyltransferase domain-containing protein n=1 Tax=Rotaria magnacalcarata TaxID=392030 RepID=A0A820AX81_9BILA|nr:unnamed protein product [Rotaria magnacalcarata]CAF4184038.1 unnamed protein product [Rotaria magnacalcarata]